MSDLAAFIRARLDDDESDWVGCANAGEPGPWSFLMDDVECKRRIVDEHHPNGHYVYRDDGTKACGTCGDYTVEWPCNTLRLLALPYAGHDHYRPEWRP